jgi:hypothetical protein
MGDESSHRPHRTGQFGAEKALAGLIMHDKAGQGAQLSRGMQQD